MAAKKTSPKKPSKSDFIRQQSKDLSVKDVIAKGKEAGLIFSEALVYSLRKPVGGKGTAKKSSPKKSASKNASSKRGTSKKAPTTSKKTTSKPTSTSKQSPKPTASNGTRPSGSSVEALLLAAASEVGLGRALEILQGERARVRAVLDGQ